MGLQYCISCSRTICTIEVPQKTSKNMQYIITEWCPKWLHLAILAKIDPHNLTHFFYFPTFMTHINVDNYISAFRLLLTAETLRDWYGQSGSSEFELISAFFCSIGQESIKKTVAISDVKCVGSSKHQRLVSIDDSIHIRMRRHLIPLS